MSRISEMNPGVPAGAQRYLILRFIEFPTISSLEPICLRCSCELASWEKTQKENGWISDALCLPIKYYKSFTRMPLSISRTPYLAPPAGRFNDQKHAAYFFLFFFFQFAVVAAEIIWQRLVMIIIVPVELFRIVLETFSFFFNVPHLF